MTKLSPAQVAILRRMGEGEEVGKWSYGIRVDSLWSLQRQGFIEDVGPSWGPGHYRITPAGQAYLEEAGE